MAGPWEKYGGGAPAAQSAPARIYGAPPTMTPAQTSSNEIAQANYNLNLKQDARQEQQFQQTQAEKAQEAAAASDQENRARAASKDNLSNDLAKIDAIIADAQDNGGWFETGATGALAGAFPGSPAYSLRSDITTLKAKNAFAGLASLAEQGIKLTPVSNDEIKLAAASIANLDPNTDQATFINNLKATREYYARALQNLVGESNQQVSPLAAARNVADQVVGAAANPQTPPPGGPDTRGGLPVGTPIQFNMDTPEETQGFRLDNDQLSELQAFMAENPQATGAEINAFARGAFRANLGTPEEVQAAADYYRRTGQMPGVSYSRADEMRRAELDAQLAARNQSGGSSAAQLFASGYTGTLADEASGIAGGIGGFLTGGIPGAVEGYQNERDLVRRMDEVGRENVGVAPEIAGAVGSPLGAFTRPTSSVRVAANRGALSGTIFGFGSGEGAAGSALGAVTGGVGGYAAGGALQAGVNALAPRVANALNARSAGRADEYTAGVPVVEAGQRQNIPIRQPDARPALRDDFAALEASPNVGPGIQTQIRRDAEAVQSRLQEVGGTGTPGDKFATGEILQGAVQRFIVKSRNQANALYRRAEQMAGNAVIPPNKAVQAIDAEIAELKASGERTSSGTISYLEDVRADLLQNGGLTIEGLRGLRTNMRGQINQRNLTMTDAERRVIKVLNAASDDISAALPPRAKAAYDGADKFFREKQTFIKDIGQKFIGSRNAPISAENASARFEAMTKNRGDYKRFREMMQRLEPEERADIAATVAEGLGRKGADGVGEFSLSTLATNIDKMSPRAIRELFGEDGAKAIADLRIIARAKADTAGRFNNSSTARVRNREGLKDILLGGFGYTAGGVAGAAAGMATRSIVSRLGDARAARLLMNPDFAKWLKNAPTTANPATINAYFNRLETIGARTPALTADVQAMQQALREAFSVSPGRLAASEDEGNRRPEPPQQ